MDNIEERGLERNRGSGLTGTRGYTVLMLRMAHMIWKETKQQPGTAGPGNMLGCCLISFHLPY